MESQYFLSVVPGVGFLPCKYGLGWEKGDLLPQPCLWEQSLCNTKGKKQQPEPVDPEWELGGQGSPVFLAVYAWDRVSITCK